MTFLNDSLFHLFNPLVPLKYLRRCSRRYIHLFYLFELLDLNPYYWSFADMKIVAGTTGVPEEPSGPIIRTLVQSRTFLGKKAQKLSDFALKSLNLSKME